MKKLMIAVFAVAMATAANAAKYTWGMRDCDNVDHNGAVQTSGSALLFLGTVGQTLNSDGTYALDFSAATFITAMAAPIYQDEAWVIGEIYPSKTRDSALIADKYAGESSVDSTPFSILVTEKTGIGESNYADFEGWYYVAKGDSMGMFDADGDFDYADFTSWDVVGEDALWRTAATSGVPEPTSGLLLLIGVAGLALKRKRA